MANTFIKATLNRRATEEHQEAERFMPSILATEFMQGALARFLKKK